MYDDKLKLLIAVESIMTRGSIKKILSSSNLAMFFASGDDDALITMRDKQPHVVIIDWNLPKRGASHVLKIAYEENLNAEFIVIDPNEEAPSKESSIFSNVRRYLKLPIQKSDLTGEITSILEEKFNNE